MGRHGEELRLEDGAAMVNGLKLPEEFRERVEDILAGRAEPVPARDAATVG